MTTRKAGRKPIFLRIAAELRDRISRGFFDEPRSMRDLCALHAVSLRTMGKAVHLLSDEGLIDCSQGRRLRRAGREERPAASPAESRFYETVKGRILGGTYRWGRPIPKVNYFAASDSVSPNTIAAACARLSREGLLHKQGKQWLVGTAAPALQATGARRRPTILLLFRFGKEWQPFFSHTWIARYSAPFAAELQLAGRETSMAFMDSGDSPSELPVPAGAREVAAYARSLGDRYEGAHVYFGISPPPEGGECIEDLLRIGKPVVFFDHNDRHRAFAEEFARRHRKLFFRCHMDEERAVGLVLRSLTTLGHTRIGVPTYTSPLLDWIPRRVERIREAARRMEPQPEIIFAEQHEPFWRYDKDFDLSLYTQQIASAVNGRSGAAPGPAVRHTALRFRLLAHTPSITGLLDKGVTAIIALNDGMARELYLWSRYAGLRIPGDVSIISFDNSVDCRNIPVTTIDFGFAHLGYLAAHALIGDLPVTGDRRGNMPGECTVIDRGSVAAARP
jgi:DNA-binding LacI/PurR family transcriptional regulator/DNA-binding transcriptional regulator YhcF (GntR family)